MSLPTLFVCDPKRTGDFKTLLNDLDINNATSGVWENSDSDAGTLFAKALKASEDFDTVPRDENDLAAILYTSGTTGRSKGAMLSHNNLLSNAFALKDYWQFSDEGKLLHALPIFHTHGLFVATNVTLVAGSSLIFLPAFNADAIIDYLPNVSCMMGVPTFYTTLLDDQRLDRNLV